MLSASDSEQANPTLPLDALERMGQVAEAVAATTKKLEKAALLGEYFRSLGDVDLARAARYFAGHQFPLNDARTTNVGGSIISDALANATGYSAEELFPRYVRLVTRARRRLRPSGMPGAPDRFHRSTDGN